MSNYYAIATTFIPGAKVRSDEVNAELAGISAGFDLLPTDANAIVEGKAYRGTEGGSGNSYTITMDDTRTAYADGDRVSFKATHTNTGVASLKLDALSLISLVTADGSACVAGDILSGRWYEAVYIAASNHFQLLSLNAELLTSASTQVGYAQEWATKAEDSLISVAAGGDGATDYSALHWATNADVLSTNADVVTTTQDALDTAADVVLTNADVVTTAASAAAALVSENNADGYATAASADAVATAADLVQTNLDQISCAADAVSTAADAVDTAADVVLTAADVTYADEWATKAEDSLVSVAAGGDGSTDYSALHWAAKAAASAATINLPAIIGGDADKILEVNAGETGYELTARQATDAATGFVELATPAEVVTGTDSDRAVTPAGLAGKTASETEVGIIEIATAAEVAAVTSNTLAVTPLGLLSQPAAGVANKGIIEIAIGSEITTGTDATRAVAPAYLEDHCGAVVASYITSNQTSSNNTLTDTSMACQLNRTGKYKVDIFFGCDMSAATGTSFGLNLSATTGTAPSNGITAWKIYSANADQIEQIVRDTGAHLTNSYT